METKDRLPGDRLWVWVSLDQVLGRAEVCRPQAAVPRGTGRPTCPRPSLSLPGLLCVWALGGSAAALGLGRLLSPGLFQPLSDSGPRPPCPFFPQGLLTHLPVLTGSPQTCCSSTEMYCLSISPLWRPHMCPWRTHSIQTALPPGFDRRRHGK